MSDRPPGGRTANDAGTAIANVRDGSAALPPSYRTKFVKVNKARFVSQGHAAGRWEVDVFANDVAAKALAARAHEVPVGAIVVEEHYERGSDKPRGPTMLMESVPPASRRSTATGAGPSSAHKVSS